MSRRRRKQRGLRAPLVSYTGGGELVALKPAPSKTHNAHGWAQSEPARDAVTHAQATARVLDALRNDTQNLLKTLDAFGCGASTRVLCVVERPIVADVVGAAMRADVGIALRDDGERPLIELASVIRAHGHLLVIAPIALAPRLVRLVAEAQPRSTDFVDEDDLLEQLEDITAPRIVVTRFGVSIESMEGRPQ